MPIRCLLLLACLVPLLPGVVVRDVNTPLQVATVYFDSLTAGDLDTLDGLYTAPFACDGERLDTPESIAQMHQEVLAHQGRRAVPRYAAEPDPAAPLPDPAAFGPLTAIGITILEGAAKDRKILIFVRTGGFGERPKVAGFRG